MHGRRPHPTNPLLNFPHRTIKYRNIEKEAHHKFFYMPQQFEADDLEEPDFVVSPADRLMVGFLLSAVWSALGAV